MSKKKTIKLYLILTAIIIPTLVALGYVINESQQPLLTILAAIIAAVLGTIFGGYLVVITYEDDVD